MKTEILCTLGPSSLNDRVIARLEEMGATLFRINLSHTKLSDLADILKYVQGRTKVPVCLDTEGAQIRTGDFVDGEINIRENSLIRAYRDSVPGDSYRIHLYPKEAFDVIQEGDFISIDFHSVLVQVIAKETGNITLRVLNGGKIGRNKAVTIERDILLPTLTLKDKQALEIGKKLNVRHIALSFANRASDVDLIRNLYGNDAFLISKIECRNALIHLDEIAKKSDALLIDRGDLSRQEPIERIPRLQKTIIRRAKELKKKVYVATNLLESMVVTSKPTRAEVNDVINTLIDGADGLVLAAETAVGKDPIGCMNMVVKLVHEYESGFDEGTVYYPSDIQSLLTDPHGGRLVHRELKSPDQKELGSLQFLTVRKTDWMNCEQIALGTYSPLTGFMNRDALEDVLENNRLPSGVSWTMPIILQVSKDKAKNIVKGRRIALKDDSGAIFALMDVAQVYPFDMSLLCKKWFGAESLNHPGVNNLMRGGEMMIGGEIWLVRRLDSEFRQYQLTPSQSRFLFAHKGWTRVIGFHTRDVIHRAHEHIQMQALEMSHADGLYISPAIGKNQSGDFLPEPVIKSYQMMLDFGFYPAGKVVIGCLMTYPRFCGPREAVFTALCYKNMGCSHFVIEQDDVGLGDFYRYEDYRKLFDTFNDLNIIPLFFDKVGYDPAKVE